MQCNDDSLAVLLHDEEDSAEFLSVSQHVESCPKCQHRLQEISCDPKLLREVRETLQDCGQTEQFHSNGASSVVIAVDGHWDDDFLAECEPISLDFLSPPSHPEMLGRIGRYEVERIIGSGGMGIVLKGFDTELHRVVAIKVLKPHLAHNGAARRRFAREAQSAAAVVHEHVIPIHDVLTDGDTPYLVMQFVAGNSLQHRVDERGPLDAREVVRIARQAAAGLAAAHAQGVVHRDVKPANILLEESVDRVLISDFGLARTVDDATLTRTGVVAGTPHYMSPEQAAGKPVDHRSDLFSLGSVIYFMCTGRPPFRADHALAILNRICHDEPRPVDEVNTEVPPELADVVDRLLSKNPAKRFRDANEVEQQLEQILVRLQNGTSARRPRWMRTWRRRRIFVQRAAFAIVSVTACVLAGLLIAGSDLVQRPSRVTAASDRDRAQPAVSAAPPAETSFNRETSLVIKFPPDGTEPNSEDTSRILQTLRLKLDSVAGNSSQSTNKPDGWTNELEEVRQMIDELESATWVQKKDEGR
ncbi:MAG: serine/threonine-protein kinase [Planctomycetaceae bacterium]